MSDFSSVNGSNLAKKHSAIAALLFVVASAVPLHAQNVWEHTTIKEPVTNRVVDRFVLAGDYAEPQNRDPAPILALCRNEKSLRDLVR
jgi:hypothetical protein